MKQRATDEPDLRGDLPEVLVVKPGTSPEELGAYILGTGPMPEGAHGETFKEFSSRGRVEDCDCQLIQCVCAVARLHRPDCQYRFAMTCAVPIACATHGEDICPVCDPCSCGGEV